jgi:hypothetical protein
MRRIAIQYFLPLAFCTIPFLAAALVTVSIPVDAFRFYLSHISSIDWLILGIGTVLFLTQMLFTWQAFRWRERGFDEGADRWLTFLAQAAEWFPLLGLLGTVAGILQTFGSIDGPVEPARIIALYAPAITATGSGLFMALCNILPTWIVLFGRELILGLAGGEVSRVGRTPP